MDDIVDDYLTNLSWLKLPIQRDRRSKKADCDHHYIDDELQCLCWLDQIRPRSSSHLLKRISMTKKKPHRFLSSTENEQDISSFREVSRTRTWNNPLLLNKTSQHYQSFMIIRLSNGKIYCLAIDQNFH